MRGTILLSVLLVVLTNRQACADWDSYPTYPAYVAMMEKLQTDYPNLCKIVEFGKSVKGKKLLCAKISDNVTTREAEPRFLYSSTIHGDEVCGYVLMIRLIDYLLSNYGKDEMVTRLVDSVEIWINPLFNPDGTYNENPMAQKGPNANGVDLNRNLPNPVGGLHPDGKEWQPETMSMMALADSATFTMSANFHGGAELFIYPYDCWNTLHADNDWWIYISKGYVDTVYKYCNSGYMTGGNNGIKNGYDWYFAIGTRKDYMNYYAYCREAAIELSMTKILAASQLPIHWNYNYRSFLQYIQQVLYGIKGTVTDSLTGEPIRAKVGIENHDRDSSHVYSLLPHGDYYRPIISGDYTITFSAPGYTSRTVAGVTVNNNTATVLNVKLLKDQTPIINKNKISGLTVVNCRGHIKIAYTAKRHTRAQAAIFDMSGRLIRKLNIESGIENQVITWDRADDRGKPVSNGC